MRYDEAIGKSDPNLGTVARDVEEAEITATRGYH